MAFYNIKEKIAQYEIGGHPATEVIGAIFIILWAVIKFIAIVALVIASAWLAWNVFIAVVFFLILGFFAHFKTKW